MKIVIGTVNIANILTGFYSGFKNLGHDVEVVVKNPSKFYNDDDFTRIYQKQSVSSIKLLKRSLNKVWTQTQQYHLRNKLNDLLPGTDLFVFVWDSFLPDLKDLKKIKEGGAKIVMAFAGSEVRYSRAYAEEFKTDISLWEDQLVNDSLSEKLKFVRTAEKYSDLILSVPDQSGLMVAPYDHFFLPCDLSMLPYNSSTNEVLRIVHAPTRTGGKGTAFFNEVMEQLRSEGHVFDYHFLQGLTHENLLKELYKSDILLDELYTYGPGMMGTEAMACGCVVATRKLELNSHIFDPPCFPIERKNLLAQIKSLLQNREKIIELKKKGRAFVEKNNQGSVVCKSILEKIDSTKRDYYPTYFSNSRFAKM